MCLRGQLVRAVVHLVNPDDLSHPEGRHHIGHGLARIAEVLGASFSFYTGLENDL